VNEVIIIESQEIPYDLKVVPATLTIKIVKISKKPGPWISPDMFLNTLLRSYITKKILKKV
jgi:hypothetical protein